MRTITTNGITCRYPDAVAFAYNPNYIEISGATGNSQATVSLQKTGIAGSAKTITASIYSGKSKIFISTLLQLLTQAESNDFPKYNRSVSVTCKVTIGSAAFNLTFYTIAGSMEISLVDGQIGQYIYDSTEGAFERHLRWWKHYPATVTVFSQASMQVKKKADSGSLTMVETLSANTIKEYNLNTILPSANSRALLQLTPTSADSTKAFGASHDYSFGTLAHTKQLIRISIDNTKEGHYLRWVDNLGQIQYWLFAKGASISKAAEGEALETDAEYDGMLYGQIKCVFDKTNEREVKCAAVNVTKEELIYLNTIFGAIDVEIYLESGAWLPVRIKSDTIEMNEKRDLFDFEITIQLPTQQTQHR